MALLYFLIAAVASIIIYWNLNRLGWKKSIG
jgi:hypothetical protein